SPGSRRCCASGDRGRGSRRSPTRQAGRQAGSGRRPSMRRRAPPWQGIAVRIEGRLTWRDYGWASAELQVADLANGTRSEPRSQAEAHQPWRIEELGAALGEVVDGHAVRPDILEPRLSIGGREPRGRVGRAAPGEDGVRVAP